MKKEGKNKGKWFYTCQQEPDKRCGLFIWADEAQRREASAVLNNSRTEQLQENISRPDSSNRVNMTPLTGHQRDEAQDSTESEPEPSPSRRKADSRRTTKRTATMAWLDQDDEDFDTDFTMDAAEAEALVNITDSVEPATPVKATHHTAYATPATTVKRRKLPWQMDDTTVPAQPVLKTRIDELLTPAKTPQSMDKASILTEEVTTPVRAPSAASHLGDQEATPSRAVITTPDRPIPAEPEAPQHPPSPQRYYDALANPDDSTSVLAAEVSAELSGLDIPPETMMKVRSILSRHELKSQGILKGRDMTRVALKSEQETTRMLQRRVQTLENELALQKALKLANKAGRLRQ